MSVSGLKKAMFVVPFECFATCLVLSIGICLIFDNSNSSKIACLKYFLSYNINFSIISNNGSNNF